MFKKQFDSASITGVKADEKFQVEGASAAAVFGKEKIISELAVLQEQARKESSEGLGTVAKSIIQPGRAGSGDAANPTGTAGSMMGGTANSKFSPFRS